MKMVVEIEVEAVNAEEAWEKRRGTVKEIKTDLRDALVLWFFKNRIAMKKLRIDGVKVTWADLERVESRKSLEAL